MKNVGSVLKEGFPCQWNYPKPEWAALGGNEVPITGGSQGNLENHAWDDMEGTGAGGFQESFLFDSKIW